MCTNHAESANVCRTPFNEHANYTCALSLMSWESLGDAGTQLVVWCYLAIHQGEFAVLDSL